MTFTKEQKVVVILLVLMILAIVSILSYRKEQNHQNHRHVLINEEDEVFSDPPVVKGIENEDKSEYDNKTEKIAIHIEGAVKNPGLYYLQDNSRYDDAVKIAGGLLEGADRSKVNLAKKIYDEAFIYIPLIGEVWEPGMESFSENNQEIQEGHSGEALVNINTATQEELMKLSGIGEVYAQRIIDYRTTNGAFQSIEDIKKVSGIGNITFENIKEQITK